MELPFQLNFSENSAEKATLTVYKWRMTVYGWLKVKLFYYISITLNKLSTAFYSLAICAFSSWDFFFFFVTWRFLESKAVSVGQISKKFELKKTCPHPSRYFLDRSKFISTNLSLFQMVHLWYFCNETAVLTWWNTNQSSKWKILAAQFTMFFNIFYNII